MAEVDAESFSRLLVILLDNAVRYSPIGSPVEVVTEGDNGKLVMSVIDRGIGVPEEEREKIFERFYQVESAIHKGTSGLGLGLYVGKQIVEAHGGEIDYRPRQGSGSIFRVTLPR
jgi:signal transduction histidine kinase